MKANSETVRYPLAGVRGGEVLVDRASLPLLRGRSWSRMKSKRYARASVGGKTVMMHRHLMGLEIGDPRFVDHINGDGLDNRSANLRICTPGQNMMNSVIGRGGRSRFRGVSPESRRTWRAQIQVKGKRTYLGCFPSEKIAAQAYDDAAKALYGDFAKLNFTADGRPWFEAEAT